jgi:ferredoxin-NADP reductase
MPIYTLKLIHKQEVARGTVVFQFEKPAGFKFTPGQYGGFTTHGLTRRFSLMSTPEDNFIAFVTRLQNSEFKNVLNTLPLGSEIKFAGPTGVFTLHTDITVPAVFIAGGIGIAPFYSMLQHALKQYSSQTFTLFYGNQSPADSAFLAELRQLQQQNSHFKFVPTMAQPDAAWQGETGYITHTLIKHIVGDLSTPLYYVCGSPTMVQALHETLLEMGIAKERIRVEDFPGY